ncbi:Hypothetical protein ABZS17D1_04283 (plasmid) [Kosakonia cowanii]
MPRPGSPYRGFTDRLSHRPDDLRLFALCLRAEGIVRPGEQLCLMSTKEEFQRCLVVAGDKRPL